MNELQVKVAGSCWRARMDTAAIAKVVKLPEPVIYNNLHLIKAAAKE